MESKKETLNHHAQREIETVGQMIGIYCKAHHRGGEVLCLECKALLEYSTKRIRNCPKGDRKTSCRKCEIHCYQPEMREKIRKVMRYSGPRMIIYHPLAALRHMISEL